MPFPLTPTVNSAPKTLINFPAVLISFLLILSHGFITAAEADNVAKHMINIGAILNNNTRIGKEVETAIKIAVQNFHNNSNNYNLSLYFQNPGTDPLQAAYAG